MKGTKSMGEIAKGIVDKIGTPNPRTESQVRSEYDAFMARRAERERQATATERGIPKGDAVRVFAMAHSRDVRVTPALAAVRQAMAWRAQFAQAKPVRTKPLLLVLCGPTGIGKSVAMARAVHASKRSARMVRANDVAATPRNFGDTRALVETWTAKDLLAIDEVGLETAGREMQGRINIVDLIVDRYDRGHATLVATNMSVEQFVKVYAAEQIVDRVEGDQRDLPWIVQLSGESLRGT